MIEEERKKEMKAFYHKKGGHVTIKIQISSLNYISK